MSARRLLLAATLLLAGTAQAATRLIVLTGLAGEAGYEDTFAAQSRGFAAAFESAGAEVVRLADESGRREGVEQALAAAAGALQADDRLVFVYVGHGSWDGRNFRFNVAGPDFTAQELAGWLEAVPAWQLVVLTSSASGAAIGPLEHDRRSLMTATRSGEQSNVTVFGAYLVDALGAADADLNRDGDLSLTEAFEYAESAVADHYESRRLMATEHPQLVNARSLFVLSSLEQPGLRDPTRAAALEERERVEAAIEALKDRKQTLSVEDYFAELQHLLLELALIEERLDGEVRP